MYKLNRVSQQKNEKKRKKEIFMHIISQSIIIKKAGNNGNSFRFLNEKLKKLKFIFFLIKNEEANWI